MKKHLTAILVFLSAALFVLLLPRLDLAKVTAAETAPRADASALNPGGIYLDSDEDLPPVRQEFENQPCGPNLWNVNGSSPVPMGETRDRVIITTDYPVVWYPGQVLKVRRGGWTYGEFTILGIQ